MTGQPDQEHIKTALTRNDATDLDLIELLYFAYREFTSDPDMILETIDFGRAHHRVIYFINRKPGMTVAELLDTLKITLREALELNRQDARSAAGGDFLEVKIA